MVVVTITRFIFPSQLNTGPGATDRSEARSKCAF